MTTFLDPQDPLATPARSRGLQSDEDSPDTGGEDDPPPPPPITPINRSPGKPLSTPRPGAGPR